MKRYKICMSCGKEIKYEVGRGKDRSFCDDPPCVEKRRKDKIRLRLETLGQCKVEGCTNKANRIKSGLCEACYMRMRRNGTTDRITYPYRTFNQAGYARVRERDHILADTTGTVYEHRKVYHDRYRDGPFVCHWCGRQVTWLDMHIDHLDDDITNNDITNLVASCPLCNQARGRDKMKIKMKTEYGHLITFNNKTMCLSDWAKEIGIGRSALQFRINKGWSISRALTEPRGKTGPK